MRCARCAARVKSSASGNGDLHINVKVHGPRALRKRGCRHSRISVPISFPQAVLGASIDVPDARRQSADESPSRHASRGRCFAFAARVFPVYGGYGKGRSARDRSRSKFPQEISRTTAETHHRARSTRSATRRHTRAGEFPHASCADFSTAKSLTCVIGRQLAKVRPMRAAAILCIHRRRHCSSGAPRTKKHTAKTEATCSGENRSGCCREEPRLQRRKRPPPTRCRSTTTPAKYKVELDTTKGPDHHRRPHATGRPGRSRRASIELVNERLLHGRCVLPRDRRLHGAGRNKRGPCDSAPYGERQVDRQTIR